MTPAKRLAERYKAAKAPKLTPAEIRKFKEMGADAFKRGVKAAPALDREFGKWLKENSAPIGEGKSAEAMKAWSDGWHEANLKAK